jgi:biotin carboxyl carrier protein
MKFKTGKKRIKELKEIMKDTDMEKVCFEQDGFNIGIRLEPELSPREKAQEKADKKEAAAEKLAAEAPDTTLVTSNTVGLFYSYILPSRKILGKKGQEVNKGQRIGVIESMSIMKDVKAPVDGKIKERYIKNGDPVEYGQELFLIENV